MGEQQTDLASVDSTRRAGATHLPRTHAGSVEDGESGQIDKVRGIFEAPRRRGGDDIL